VAISILLAGASLAVIISRLGGLVMGLQRGGGWKNQHQGGRE